MRFHEKLQKAMADQGLWTAELIRRAGLERSQSAVQEWINGTASPSKLEDALGLSKALGLPLDYLVDDEVDTPQQMGLELSKARKRIMEIADKEGEDEIRMVLEQVARLGASKAMDRLLLHETPEPIGQVPPPGKGKGRPRR